MNKKLLAWVTAAILLLITVCFLGILIGNAVTKRAYQSSLAFIEAEKTSAEKIQIHLPTTTPFPTPQPPLLPDDTSLANNELEELVAYANAMQPLLRRADELSHYSGDLVEEASAGENALLCDGRLISYRICMQIVVNQIKMITPPPDMQAIHDLVIESGTNRIDSSSQLQQYCRTGDPPYRDDALPTFWKAGSNLQIANNRFWLLLMAKGVEDHVRR